MAASFDAPMVPVLLELGANVNERGIMAVLQTSVEDVTVLHVLARNPNGRIPRRLTSLLHHFLGIDPDRSGSSTMSLSPLNHLWNSSHLNAAWNVADVLAFTELIVGIWEMNWDAGLFLESERIYREDFSHERMKRWISAVSRALSEDGGCECLRWGDEWRMWWDIWPNDGCCITATGKPSNLNVEGDYGLYGADGDEEIDESGTEVFYDAAENSPQ